MLWYFLCVWFLVVQNPAVEIARIEKAAERKPVQLLVPTVTSYSNMNAGAELFHAPSGKSLIYVPRGLPVHVLERRADGWSRVAILSPFVMEGWAHPKGLAYIINASTFFYASANDTNARGMLAQGVMVQMEKRVGDMVQVQVHHHIPIRVWVPAARVGVKFENVPAVNFRYKSRWNRNVFECSPGPLYASLGSSVVIAELREKAFFKKEKESGDWIEIASASDYDIRFKAWVPAKRMGAQAQYYYQHQYSFRVSEILTDSWFTGGFVLTRPMAAWLHRNDTMGQVYLRAGTRLNMIQKQSEGVYQVILSRGVSFYRPTLSVLLNALENETSKQQYGAYQPTWYAQSFTLRVWMSLELTDVTRAPMQ